MSYSRQTLVADIRRILNDNPSQDTCTEAMDTTETALDVADGTLYAAGGVVEFQDDGEQCLIQSVSGNTLTVVRNYNFSVGTTAGTGTSHSINTAILRDPTFPYKHITDAISAAINGLWPYVYKEITDSFTPTPGTKWYNVSTASIAMLELSSAVQVTTSTVPEPYYYGTNRKTDLIELRFNVPTAIAANGMAYYITGANNQTNAINISGIGAITDTVATGNYSDFSAGMEADCIKYYAVDRLIGSTDISRTTAEDISMGDKTVPAGSRSRLASVWERRALIERNKWAMQLEITLPRMKKWGHF